MTNHIYTIDNLQIDLSRFSQESRAFQSAEYKATKEKLDLWLSGGAINHTENRSAMHMALRAKKGDSWPVEMIDSVLATKNKMQALCDQCEAKTLVHIGVGGSDFGPRLVTDALKYSYKAKRDTHFLSTLTPQEIKATLDQVDPDTTIFIVASKSFGTDETLFVLDILQNEYNVPKNNIIAVTASNEKAVSKDISPDNVLPLWDWVGGRFSLWSSVGLSIALSYGFDIFEELLRGARAIDLDLHHKRSQSIIWQLAELLTAERHIHNRYGLALLPYDSRLALLPAYAQQLVMESNGKKDDPKSAPIIFGQTGTEFQHSFGQYLHQGPDLCLPCLITIDENHEEAWMKKARQKLNINATAQADTLWNGLDHDEQHRHLHGKRASFTINLPDLSAYNLGQLLALFEHVTVCDAFLNGINPFDQWGVEAGKTKAVELANISV